MSSGRADCLQAAWSKVITPHFGSRCLLFAGTDHFFSTCEEDLVSEFCLNFILGVLKLIDTCARASFRCRTRDTSIQHKAAVLDTFSKAPGGAVSTKKTKKKTRKHSLSHTALSLWLGGFMACKPFHICFRRDSTLHACLHSSPCNISALHLNSAAFPTRPASRKQCIYWCFALEALRVTQRPDSMTIGSLAVSAAQETLPRKKKGTFFFPV